MADVISMDVPLFIRVLEFAREEAKDDEALHKAVENALAIDHPLKMEDYDTIISGVNMTKSNVTESRAQKLLKIYNEDLLGLAEPKTPISPQDFIDLLGAEVVGYYNSIATDDDEGKIESIDATLKRHEYPADWSEDETAYVLATINWG